MARLKAQNGVTLIASDSEVIGDVRFKDQLYVNGHVEGNIVSTSDDSATLIVSEEGSVSGEIRVPCVVINGSVEGNVYASARLELAANARVKGNVYYQLIEMQLGARVEGQLLHEETAGVTNVHRFPAEGAGEPEVGKDANRSVERS